jgi:hypothetical protein
VARLLVGVLIGVALAVAAGWVLVPHDDCFGRCGDGTQCKDHRCVVVAVAQTAPPSRDRKRRARRDSAAAPEIHLQPGDEKMIAEGDALGRPEKIDLSEPDAKELSQDDLDSVFHSASGRIEKCITDALGDAPLESGRVEIGFRVEKSGAVSRVRVEAPALLQHNGLTKCARGAVASLRFPASGGASVVTYPFELK